MSKTKEAAPKVRRVHFDEVMKIAEWHHVQDPIESVASFTRFLKYWFCTKYNLPFKTPLLKEYTLDELLYEYLRVQHFTDPKNDPKARLKAEAEKADEDDWIKRQLAQEEAKPLPGELPPEVSTTFE